MQKIYRKPSGICRRKEQINTRKSNKLVSDLISPKLKTIEKDIGNQGLSIRLANRGDLDKIQKLITKLCSPFVVQQLSESCLFLSLRSGMSVVVVVAVLRMKPQSTRRHHVWLVGKF